MNRTLRIAAFCLTVAFVADGCRRLPNPFAGERVLARAGKETLRLMDLEAVLPVAITGADSVKWVENYVDRWVRDNLKLQEATMIFGADAADEQLVTIYRNSLITRRLDEHFIRQMAGDSLYNEQDLVDYYNANRIEFILDRAIVKGRAVAFPSGFRQRTRLRELLDSWSDSARDEVLAMALKHNFTAREVTDWTEYSQFLALLPARRNEAYDRELARTGVQEMTDGDVMYLFVISEKRTAGEIAPYERVSGIVRQSVATRRRAEIIKAYEDSLYKIALIENKAMINL
ncbi:MAG: hypothetical protein LBU98_05330 [Alistipes sp.]|jgi:hypothetical protein|nr:hypothetical protein [Alistipes sp.]